ncbi:MAG: glycoside hydrolase family 99-like domain-containing protein [Methylococcaceae bacterium]|nr:glycoside hydrolase family 99-like domain-containing protein [Methylococcaceae bacterium]
MNNRLKDRTRVIAMYFPQLHAIPENDEWWGKGFTDWVNVKNAKAQFEGHHQPRVPLNDHYDHYDQSDIETLYKQIDMAKKYGVYGFCHYHYWFDGKQLLETPTNLMLENKSLDFPFCLSWANETWSKRWDGKDHHILIKQTHPPEKERWQLHFDYLIKAWTDERAIKIDGKPVFIIYRPHKIHDIDGMLDFWREKAVECGLKGLYFIVQKQHEFSSHDCLKGFDAVFQFQPFEAIYSPDFNKSPMQYSEIVRLARGLPEWIQIPLRKIRSILKENLLQQKLTYYEYDKVWREIVKIRPEIDLTTFPGAFVDWDNSARYKERATIFQGATPERFEYWLSELVKSMPERKLPEDFIFINAWNEWAEGAYLEPDTRNEYKFLEALQRVIARGDN